MSFKPFPEIRTVFLQTFHIHTGGTVFLNVTDRFISEYLDPCEEDLDFDDEPEEDLLFNDDEDL